jgi:hypothetical protein
MTTQTDVKSARIGASGNFLNEGGTANLGRVRVRGIWIDGSGGGSVQFRDGGAAGVIRINIDTAGSGNSVIIPGEGVLFKTDVYGTFTGVITGATIFYA